jgi:spore maturation protein CgeB
MRFVFLGLSITSSWGNGHATNYRGLLRALERRGHEVLFLERDVPWYAAARDLADPPFGRTELYGSLDELRNRFTTDVADADAVVVGSYVPDGTAVVEWALDNARGAVCFYDIDTPVTLAKLDRGDHEYLAPDLIPRFDLYLSFTGGRTLDRLECEFGARRARAFYCIADPELYFPESTERRWLLGYLGTYGADRQPTLERLLVDAARALPGEQFVVAGPQYPPDLTWPSNVERIEHLPPADHRGFYGAQAFTLNVTRADMVAAGWSPSVRLFEAAACGVPVISDRWDGLDALFVPGREILVAETTDDVLWILRETREDERRAIGEAARERVLREHTAERRAEELEALVAELTAVGA